MTGLQSCHVQKTRVILNRVHMFFHLTAILTLLYYRLSSLTLTSARLPWALLTAAELLLAVIWAFTQAFRWRPVTHSVTGVDDVIADELPGVDVFICTADPIKEPVLEVMNTVISAMALDYPPEKLAVYLSDDAGAEVTKVAIREASEFAKIWIPFCGKFGIKTRCPDAFFSSVGDSERPEWNQEYNEEEPIVKSKYETFKKHVELASEDESKCAVVNDRAPFVEIIHDNKQNGESKVMMPLLVYMSREKRPSLPHRFKAGALNALLRVSSLLSNGPYLLVLDCDMYCNDPTSARQAMCFHLDPKISPSLAFVQYPQIFYNTSKNDIYDGQARSAYKTKWQGMDGLRGPGLTGTGYYLKRKALYGRPTKQGGYLAEADKAFGSSEIFISSLREQNVRQGKGSDELLQEATNLATCSYEVGTQWGQEVGYSYECLLESTFTGYLLHCKGWISVYLYPKRPCFLGCTTIDMKDAMVQLMKWTSGLVGIGLSKYNPLTYAMSRMSIWQSMCYAYLTFSALFGISFLIYGIVVPLCLLRGISVFPKASDPWIMVFAGVFVSALLQHLYEVLSSDESVKTWWNEIRIWIIKSVTASLFGIMDAIMKKIGVQKVRFQLTNKMVDSEKLRRYVKGKFDFDGAQMFMVPLLLLVLLNLIAFFGGLGRVMIYKNYDEMFAQLFLSFFVLVLSYPVIEGVVTKARERRARV